MGELFDLLPDAGGRWPRPARERWLAAVAAALDLLYDDAEVHAKSPFVDGPPLDDPPGHPQLAAGWTPVAGSVLDLRAAALNPTRRAKHARPDTGAD